MRYFQFFFYLFLFLFFTASCHASSILVSGAPSLNIKRAGPWVANLGTMLQAENTLPALHKITVEATLIFPAAWQGRSVRIQIANDASWKAVSPFADFFPVVLVNDGVGTGAFDLVTDMVTGVYPVTTLLYESTADADAIAGSADVTITFTLMPQP